MSSHTDVRFASEEYLRHMMLDYMQMAEFVKEPFIVARADGIRFWDVQGKEYLDGLAGVYVVNVGYNNPQMLDAVRRQLETLPFNPPMHGTNPRAVELANLLAEITPGDLHTVRLVDSGSEANEAAFKIARQYHRQTGNPGKYKILSRYLSYHGATGSTMSASGVGYRKTVYEPAAVGFLHTYPPYCYRCPYEKSYPECDVFCARTIRTMVEWEDPRSIAAIIVEPIRGESGIRVPPNGFLPGLREICDETDVLLIFDEVQTGFGRTGKLFACEHWGVIPDVMCLAKPVAGGLPIGVTIAKENVMSSLKVGDHSTTFSGSPLGKIPDYVCEIQRIKAKEKKKFRNEI